ncbi:MAG: 4Fe-4S dicluster domain-containing protein [Alphaproteobacteria bacterium]|nr:4Fe-4S dicluster domain-containing protein [Alphaproteobacteria bacterium]
MKGTSKVRLQGYKDPLLVEVMKRHGFDEIPLYKHRPPETNARRDRWFELGKVRDGPVNGIRRPVDDPAAMAAEIKALALELGADAVGIARLTPIMIDEDADLSHAFAICAIVGEDYGEALKGPRAIETESTRTYVACAEIATELARRIRDMGYPALAHHNGGCDIQAIPAMIAAGLGELGKHGSLIHPELGASHRPGIVTTSLPLATDAPLVFGVQDTCLNCNLCANNCPGDAIPAKEFVLTEGIRRWLTDVEKCYVYSRLRAQYCHICVDACPYVHKANGDQRKKELFKRYMAQRKKAGYKTPAWFPEEAEEVLGD